jgi:hypothetical protein
MTDPEIIPPPQKPKRPAEFSDDIFTEICDRMAGGQGLRKICDDPNMPSRQTFLRWIEKDTGRQSQYQAAREALMDWYAEEILEIAWDSSKDTIPGDGKKPPRCDNEWVNRSRLKVDTLKFLMAKLHPKRYGDKLPETVEQRNHEEAINKIELVGVSANSYSWQPAIRVIVHPMLRDDGTLIPQGTPEHDAAIEAAANKAKAAGAKTVTVGYDIGDGANASVADLMRSVDGNTRSAYPEGRTKAPAGATQPLLQIAYSPTPPPADLSPEAWAAIARVSDLIERIAPSDVMPEHVFGLIEGFLRKHYLG